MTDYLQRYKDFIEAFGAKRARQLLLGEKEALASGDSSLPKKLKLQLLKKLREVERILFNSNEAVPGEDKLLGFILTKGAQK